jgi:hypothetical protein
MMSRAVQKVAMVINYDYGDYEMSFFEGNNIKFNIVKINGERFYECQEIDEFVRFMIELNAQIVKDKIKIRMALNEIIELDESRADECKSIARKALK